MKIAIYGGSFDPPHSGHIEAARTVAETLEPDLFLIVPHNLTPDKDSSEDRPTPRQRLELCRMSFRDIPGARISDMDVLRGGKSYTYDTVNDVEAEYPGSELYLVLGTDEFLELEDWYQFRSLISRCTLAVLSRTEDDTDALRSHADYMRSEYGARVEVLPHAPVEISSEDIRSRLPVRLGEDYLDADVYAVIIKNRFYSARPELPWLRTRVLEYLSAERIAHVAGCDSEAVNLAMRWGEDPEMASEAAILHDITKKLRREEQLIMCEKYGIINDADELKTPSLLHAKTGAALAGDVFGADEQVCEAIRWHTTGKPDMSLLEKIIYLADYIEPTRSFDGVEKLRELAYEDIDDAMALGLEMSVEDIRRRGTEPYHDTLDACLWYNRQEE